MDLCYYDDEPSTRKPKHPIATFLAIFSFISVLIWTSIHWRFTLVAGVDWMAPEDMNTFAEVPRRELQSMPSLTYSHGAGSIFWLLGNVLGEYPFLCTCDKTTLVEWVNGKLANQDSDKSPVPCIGQVSTSVWSSMAYCEPTLQWAYQGITPDPIVTATDAADEA